jgi:hypothetical protein
MLNGMKGVVTVVLRKEKNAPTMHSWTACYVDVDIFNGERFVVVYQYFESVP